MRITTGQRRALVLILLLASFCWTGVTQAMEYRLSLQDGVAVSNINYDPDIPTDWYKNGFFGIAWEAKQEASSFSFDIELNHVTKGSSFFELNQDKVDKYRYLELPVFVRYYPVERHRFTVYAELGASAAVNLSADQLVGTGAAAVKTPISTAKKFGFGLQAGVGTEFWFKPTFALFFSTRYAHGLTWVDDANATFNHGKLRAFELFIGPKIKL